MNSIKFYPYFKTDEDCQKFLADIKWEHYQPSICDNKKEITIFQYSKIQDSIIINTRVDLFYIIQCGISFYES